MPINLYSKDSVDDLLDEKLSISSLSNAATVTLNAGVPTAGQALTYDGTDLIWATVSGGGLTISTLSNAATATLNAGVPSSGQALVFDGTDLAWQYPTVTWGAISGTLSSQMDLQAELDLKAPLNSPVFSGYIESGGVTLTGPTANATFTYSGLDLSPSSGGITFADSTVQSTAAVAPTSAHVTANAIAANVQSMGYGSSTWVGSGNPSVAGLIGWGIHNATDGYIAYSYTSGSSFYLASSLTTLANSSVQVSGTNSSFYVA